MPQHIEPISLEDLCYQAVKIHLVTLCHKLNDNKLSPRQFRKIWISSLPGTVRTRLLMEAAVSNDGPIPFYLMSLLLAPDVDKLKIELCCYYGCSHQAGILRLLAVEGKGLRSLELERSALLRLDQSLIQSVLLNTNCLQHLIMRNIATDATLAVIGSSCERLVVLDVSNSRQVSDIGITNLFIKIELRDKIDLSDLSNFALSISTRPRNSRWHNLYKMLRSIQIVLSSCKGDIANDRVESYNDILLECYESLNFLSSTLKVLNITNTAVTSSGVYLALENSKCLQSVGDYQDMGQVLDLFNNKYENSPTFHLKYARTRDTTVHTIDLISKLCPDIEQLIIANTRFSPSELSPDSIPASLRSLILLGIPPLQTWLSDFYTFLSDLNSTAITELVLKDFCIEELVNVDIDVLLQKCPSLKILVVDAANINWSSSTQNLKTTLLEKVQLGQIVTSKALFSLIKCSPHLTVAHFYNCTHIDENEMICLTSSNLKCLYIYETRLPNASAIATELLYNCPHLQHIGNIANWGGSISSIYNVLQLARRKNYNVQFNAGSHWYYSPCISKYE